MATRRKDGLLSDEDDQKYGNGLTGDAGAAEVGTKRKNKVNLRDLADKT